MEHKITEVQIIPIKPNNGLVAFASFTFADCFYFGSIGIYTRPEGGYRLTYPTKKIGERSINLYHPINRKIATQIEEVVITKYQKVTKSYDRYCQADTR